MGVLVVGALCKASQMAFSEDLRQLSDRVRNWGRWGDDDERGTQNLIDAAATRRGFDEKRGAERPGTLEEGCGIVVLDGRRVVESGTHAELFAQSGLYRRLHDLQFSVAEVTS